MREIGKPVKPSELRKGDVFEIVSTGVHYTVKSVKPGNGCVYLVLNDLPSQAWTDLQASDYWTLRTMAGDESDTDTHVINVSEDGTWVFKEDGEMFFVVQMTEIVAQFRHEKPTVKIEVTTCPVSGEPEQKAIFMVTWPENN